MAVLGQKNHRLKGTFSELFNIGTDLRFLPEFHADLPHYKEKQLHCTPTFFAAILYPFVQGTKFYM